MKTEDVLHRIELFVKETVEVVASGELPSFHFNSRRASEHLIPFALALYPASQTTPLFVEEADDNFQNEVSWDPPRQDDDHNGTNASAEALYRKAADGRVVRRDLLSRNASSAFIIARVFRVLDCVHELLVQSKRCTQRELYYTVLNPPMFASLSDVTEAISDVCCLLQVPRSALNICCSSKGAVSGMVHIKNPHHDDWQDCRKVGLMGSPIPGDAIEIQHMQMRTTAQYVLIIEKDAVFQRLTEDRFFDLVPSILVTGRGMPDLCTRIFLQHLIEGAPHLTVLGLVDWNPSGVAILSTYKYGSSRMGPHANQYVLSSLQWLGLKKEMFDGLAKTAFHPLSHRDHSLINHLCSQLHHEASWCQELAVMRDCGMKCDIEAMYRLTSVTGFVHQLVQYILTGQYSC